MLVNLTAPSRYLLTPGTRPSLEKLPTRDYFGMPQKAERVAAAHALAQEIGVLQQLLHATQRHRLLVVLQGMDTSGKDGTIRSVFSAVAPLGVRAVNFRAPSAEERARDYLWRIHQHVPRTGEIVLFNRSHYEDVLVVRVQGLISARECAQRYHHLREFERMLVETGTTLVKIFLHISKDEQRERLQARIDDPAKHWKLQPSDLEARRQWADYMEAYEDALRETSTPHAPWHVIPADSKTARNLIVATLLRDCMVGLPLKPPDTTTDLSGLIIA